MSLSSLIPEEKRKILEIEDQILELERGNTSVDIANLSFELQSIQIRLNHLDQLVLQESKSHKDDYRRRVTHLKELYNHAKAGLDNYTKKRSRKNPYYNSFENQKSALFEGGKEENVDSSNIDIEQAEAASVYRSTRLVNDYIASGQETLSELISQRDRLKGVQRKVLDILGYLGLSNRLMKGAERRDQVDRLIVFGGMVVVLIVLVVVIKFFH